MQGGSELQQRHRLVIEVNNAYLIEGHNFNGLVQAGIHRIMLHRPNERFHPFILSKLIYKELILNLVAFEALVIVVYI